MELLEQTELESLAFRVLSNKLTSQSKQKDKNEIALIKNQVEQARLEREALLFSSSRANYKIMNVGKVIQERMKLQDVEAKRLEYIKQARGEIETHTISRRLEEKSLAEQALKRSRIIKLGEHLNSFRLAGISCFSVGGRPQDLGFRFDATYGGQYLEEKYYVILHGPTLEIHRHSLPFFVPIEELARAFLPFDPGQFCRRISRYVCAYAGRRILSDQMATDFLGRASVEASTCYDVIKVTGRLEARGGIPVHSVQLKFENLLDLIPNKADVTFLRGNGEIVAKKVILDRIPTDVSSIRFFNYSAYIQSVLAKKFVDNEEALDSEEEEAA